MRKWTFVILVPNLLISSDTGTVYICGVEGISLKDAEKKARDRAHEELSPDSDWNPDDYSVVAVFEGYVWTIWEDHGEPLDYFIKQYDKEHGHA